MKIEILINIKNYDNYVLMIGCKNPVLRIGFLYRKFTSLLEYKTYCLETIVEAFCPMVLDKEVV